MFGDPEDPAGVGARLLLAQGHFGFTEFGQNLFDGVTGAGDAGLFSTRLTLRLSGYGGPIEILCWLENPCPTERDIR